MQPQYIFQESPVEVIATIRTLGREESSGRPQKMAKITKKVKTLRYIFGWNSFGDVYFHEFAVLLPPRHTKLNNSREFHTLTYLLNDPAVPVRQHHALYHWDSVLMNAYPIRCLIHCDPANEGREEENRDKIKYLI